MATTAGIAYTAPQMASTVDLLNVLRGIGARKVSFHPDGTVASVEFEPETGEPVTTQHETSAPAVKRIARSAGGLVPREPKPDPA